MKKSSASAAASTNATSISAVAGRLKSVQVRNSTSTARYLKIYDKASAPTVGTDIPDMILTIPALGQLDLVIKGNGLPFSNGLAWAMTANKVNSDSTAVAADALRVDFAYYTG